MKPSFMSFICMLSMTEMEIGAAICKAQASYALKSSDIELIQTGNDSLFVFRRYVNSEGVLCVYNLSDQTQSATLNLSRKSDLLTLCNGSLLHTRPQLEPYAVHWLVDEG